MKRVYGKLLYFVVEKDSNVIQKITWQEKRADRFLSSPNYTVKGFNPEIYPTVSFLKVGDELDEFQIEKDKI